MRNLVITMFLGGLWHGAAWTFVVWGLLHGALPDRSQPSAPRRPDAALDGPQQVDHLRRVVVLFVIFRAPNLHVAGDVLSAMAGLDGLDSAAAIQTLVGVPLALGIAALLAFVNLAPNTWEVELARGRSTASRSAARWQPRC